MLLSLTCCRATVKTNHLECAFVQEFCYLWKAKSVMFCTLECTLHLGMYFPPLLPNVSFC